MASQLTAALRETLDLFDCAGAPKTTTEVADLLDLGRRSTYERLDRLVDHGRLETKKVGGNGRVWWRPADDVTPATDELTDGTRSEQPRRENHEQFEQLVDAVDEYAIFMLDAGGHVQTWNPGAGRIKGYETDEILGKHVSAFYTADDRDAGVPEQNLAEAATRGSVENEGWRVREDGSRFWASVTITAIRDDDGDLTGYAKVTRDMSSRHEYEKELRRQRDYTRQLLETAPVGVLTVEEDGTFATANQQATELLELEDATDGETTVGINAVYDEDGEFVPPDERPYVRAFETGEPVRNWHAQIELSSGGRRWLSTNIEPMVDESGDVERVLVTIEDVSQLKEQAERLKRQRDDLEAELESVFERVEDGFFALDDELRFTYVNNYVSDLLDRPSAELVEEYIWDAFEPTPNAEAAFEEAIETQQQTSFEEFYGPFESWFEVHVYPSEDGLSAYFRDINERKERENELERYETTVETVWDGVTTLDADERFVMVNDAFCEMTGYTREEILGEHATLILEDDAHEAAGELHDQVEEGNLDIATLEYDLQTADGGSIPMEARFGPCEFEDGTVGGTGVIRDISERKERERQLEESERRYRVLVESFPDGAVGLFDEELNYTAVGGQLVDQVGVDLDERIGYSVTDIYPDDLVEQVEPYFHAALAGETCSFEAEYHGLHLSAQTLPVRNADSEVFAGMLVVQDVTERKQREQELARFKRAVEAAGHSIYMTAPNGTINYVNPAFCDITGYSREEALGQTPGILDSGEHSDEYFERLWDTITAGERWDEEIVNQRKNGDLYTAHQIITPVTDADGDIDQFVAIQTDITERKQRERELKRFEVLFTESRDVNVVLESDGTYRYVTPSMENELGHDPDELVGESAFDYVHPEDREHVFEEFGKLVENTEQEPTVEYRFRRADGSWAVIESRGRNLLDEPEVEGIVVYSRDITERKERERELERQREQLAALNSINEVVRDITDAVIHQSTREEIEEIVCERLAAADSYELAWVGDVDAASQTVNLRTEAGVEGYSDEITISVDPEDERSQGPTGRAFRTGEMQTTQNVATDSRHDPWREHIQKYDFRSSAAIPLVHDETVYGVLNVYAGRPNAFEGREQTVIAQLGEIVGHAIAAADRKRALMSDEVVELEFLIRDVFDVFDVDVSTAGTVTFDHVVPLEDDEFLVYGSATEDAVDSVEALVDAVPHWEEVTFRTEREGTAFQLRVSEPPVLSKAASLGGAVEHASIEDGDYQMTVHLAPGADVRKVIDTVQAAYPTAEMVKRHQLTRRDASREEQIALTAGLTDRQRTALEVAVYSGYFEWPREASGEDVAESLGIAPPTFAQHIRKAQKKVFDSLFSTPIPA